MSLNSFTANDDNASAFDMNLKKETYDPLLITLTTAINGATTVPEVLNQSMLISSSAPSLQQQSRVTLSGPCNYVVHVPTSFVVSTQQIEEFYKSKQRFKQPATLNLNDAAAKVFMQWSMFEEFVRFVKKTEHDRERELIKTSYTNATTQHKTILDEMPYVWDTTLNPMTKATATLDERFKLIYTDRNLLKYFYTYMRDLYRIRIVSSAMDYSVGRIQAYVPALNSNMRQTPPQPAPHVDCTDDAANAIYAQPSYNVEIMDKFWSGIITGQGLPNRAPLSRPDKIKVIQDNTRLYTFRSTPEYSMNYDALLERLYYKYPCYLNGNGAASANTLYDNDVLMRLMKYSNNTNPLAVSPLLKADYLKKLYANPSGDEVLYAICGPVYFDYTWIFKQHPELIRHILGEDNSPPANTGTDKWEERIDPLTENKHYVNRNPSNPNDPKTRFDAANSPLPAYCNEMYISPSVAQGEIANAAANIRNATAFTAAAAVASSIPWVNQWNTDNQAANTTAAAAADIPIIYDWTTPGYYQYETITKVDDKSSKGKILTNRFTQLMRPVATPRAVQDYTEPNLPTA
jgi:hypothetical protein